MKKQTTNDIINEIEKIRILNNIKWMGILRLSFKYAKKEAQELFKDITENDKKINKLSKKLCDS